MAHSSRGLGHLPLKEEITGSNPVCATISLPLPLFEGKLGSAMTTGVGGVALKRAEWDNNEGLSEL